MHRNISHPTSFQVLVIHPLALLVKIFQHDFRLFPNKYTASLYINSENKDNCVMTLEIYFI